ncbi:MAG TPA: histone [archaeon]|nr:histone [archaeon]
MVKEFPLSPLEKILKQAGKEIGADRVATSAVKELRAVLLEMSDKLAQGAVAASHHAKRVTIKREDVIMAKR